MSLKDIKNFRATINNEGILKSNKYLAKFFFPLDHYLRGRADGINLALFERLSLRCDSVSLPGVNFSTIEGSPRLGYGPMVRIPYGINVDDMTMTFIVDSNSTVHKLFYEWSNVIVNYQSKGTTNLRSASGVRNTAHKAYEVGYLDKYKIQIEIDVYKTGAATTIIGEEPTIPAAMKVKVYDAIPLSFPQISMNWEDHQPIKLTIPFTYTDFSIDYYPSIPKE
jgi:hypothetical protein